MAGFFLHPMEILMHPLSPVLSLLVALTSPGGAQQSSACSLLTPSEIEVATGAKADATQPSDYSPSSDRSVLTPMRWNPVSLGETGHACRWTLAADRGRGHIWVSIGRLPAGTSAEAVAKRNPVMVAFRALIWTEETKTFGTTWCSVIQSTAAQENALMLSTCSAELKGMILSVAFDHPTKRLSIDQTKALLDKAIGHYR